MKQEQNTNRGKKYRSYSMTDRLKAISMSESGMGSITIGKELGIDSSLIRGWIRRYKKDGVDGLKPKSYRQSTYRQFVQQPESTRPEQEKSAENSGKRGFVHFVDNPVLVRSMVNTLSAYGLSLGDITIGDDARILAHSMAAGETLVVNSFFDLSSDFSKMLHIVEDILRAGITIVSISDNGMEIRPGYTDSLGLVTILKNYLSFSDKNDVQIDKNPIPQDFPTLHLASLSEKEQGFLTALDLYQNGHTMASAARLAGCSYTSFRYWLQNKVMQDNATGGMREIPDQR